MSRSVVALHCSRVGADVAPPLFRRLRDADPGIQATASATLCNVVLDTSPAQARRARPALRRRPLKPAGSCQLGSAVDVSFHSAGCGGGGPCEKGRAADVRRARRAQEAVLSAGGLALLVGLAAAPAAELRMNAAWALQNLMHHASADVRRAVLAALPWECVRALAADADPRVQARRRRPRVDAWKSQRGLSFRWNECLLAQHLLCWACKG